jgi:PAS domain S-box-containing protein
VSSSNPSGAGHAGDGRQLQDADTLRRLIANLPEGIYVEDAQGNILDANPALLELFGCDTVAELRRHTAEMWADPERRTERLRRLKQDSRLREFELQVRRVTGEVRTVRDPLTGCYNRRFLSNLETALDPDAAHWGVIMLDIDRFKEINDQYGHAKGDEILKRIARFILRQLRADDAVVRLGGDEFVALLFEEDTEYIEEVVGRLRGSAATEAPAPFSLG